MNNRFAASAVTCAISQLRTSIERKLSWSATRQPFTVEIAPLHVFSLSSSLFFVPFLRLSDRLHMQKQARSMPSTQAVTRSPSHNSDGSEKVQAFDKEPITTKPSTSKDSLACSGYATINCAILSKYELLRANARGQLASAHRQLASARRQVGTGLVSSFKPLLISPRCPWQSLLSFVFNLDHDFFFSEKTNTDKKSGACTA